MRKRPRGDSRRKSRTNAATAESRNPVLASAMSADPDGSPSKTMDGAVAVIAATPSDGAVRSACGSDSAVSSDNRDCIPKDAVALHRLGVNRLGNVLVPNESYGIVLEKKLQPMLRDLWKEGRKSLSTKELLWEFGRRTESRDSLLWWAWKNRIPVYVPAIFDGAVGYQLWSFWQDHKDFSIDQFRDEGELSDLVFGAKESGALMIGGGVSKHHTIWWNQFRGGLDLAVYITTAPEWDGSLSGARLREGISWGKVKETAKQVTIERDATAILPLMIAAALVRPRR